MPTAQMTISSRTVQPTNATTAVSRRSNPRRAGCPSQDAIERRDEELADVQDAGHESVGFAGVEQEQDEARSDDDLDEPEQEDDDPSGHLRRAGPRRGGD